MLLSLIFIKIYNKANNNKETVHMGTCHDRIYRY